MPIGAAKTRNRINLGTILSPFQTIIKEMNKSQPENRLPDPTPTDRREQSLRVLEQYPSGRRYRIPKKVEGQL